MWIFLPDSFLSIVAFRGEPNGLMVRARFPGDIERVFPRAKVTETPCGDYLFRARVTRRQVAKALELQAMTMAYPNVKAEIDPMDRMRQDAMHDVWEVMLLAQRQAKRPHARAARSAGLDLL
jgi:hypothetical protein